MSVKVIVGYKKKTQDNCQPSSFNWVKWSWTPSVINTVQTFSLHTPSSQLSKYYSDVCASKKRKKMHMQVINGHLYYLHSTLRSLARGAHPYTKQSRKKITSFCDLVLYDHTKWNTFPIYVSSCVSLAVACKY